MREYATVYRFAATVIALGLITCARPAQSTDAEWMDLFHDRYLAFHKVDAELTAASRHG